jgi:hypothetical protein
MFFNITMSESIYSQSVLSNAIIKLANAFREAGYNPPGKIEVDSQTFDKLLAEAMELYNIDSKIAIIERKFSIADTIAIVEKIHQ